MTAENFAYWLNGFFEVADPKSLSTEQIAMIREHLDLVFAKVTGKFPPIKKEPTYCAPKVSPRVLPTIFPVLPETDGPNLPQVLPGVNPFYTPSFDWPPGTTPAGPYKLGDLIC